MNVINSRIRRCLLAAMLIVLLFSFAQFVRAADPITARVMMAPIANLDPVSLPRNSSARDLAENIFVGLTRYDPASGQIQPELARSWTVSDDGLTWTFALRDDVSWVVYNSSTGTVEAIRPVVAGDFVYAMRRACEPTLPNPVTNEVYVVKGCIEIATTDPLQINDVYVAQTLGVRVVNDQTLEIKLAFAAPYLVSLVSMPEFRPVPREAVNKDPDWTQAGVIMTSGPWALAASTRNGDTLSAVTLIRNPLWPDKLAGNVDRIEISFGQSADIVSSFGARKIDFARLDSAAAETIAQNAPASILTAPAPQITVLGFSTERTTVQKDAFRRALSQAIDRASLVKTALANFALPISRFVPPGVIGGPTTPPDNSGFLPDAAKASISAAGFPRCQVNDRLDFLVEDRPDMLAVAQALSDQWKAVLGCTPYTIKVVKGAGDKVEDVAHGTISTVNQNEPPRPHMWLYTWAADYLDANAFLGDALHCDQIGYLRTGLPCSNADLLIDAAAVEKDPASRAATYAQVEALWFGPTGTFPVVPLYVSFTAVAKQSWLNGVTANGQLRFDLWTLDAGAQAK